jgi:hypothetical protein
MSKFYTYAHWEDTFRPVKNTISKYASDDDDSLIHFETYGEEYEFVKSQPNTNVWTEVDGESGTYILAGLHFVNRIHYYVTEEAWTDEYTEVPTWVYNQCACAEDEEFEHDGYNPDCTVDGCEEGTIDGSCETVADLQKIYGEDAPIVG